MKLIFLAILFSASQKCNGITPVDENPTIIEVFLGQNFQSEICESADPLHWRINDIPLINTTILERFNAKANVSSNSVTGGHQNTLILKQVNFTLNDSVVTCLAISTPILNYTLIVVNTTTKRLSLNDVFRPPVCKSPLTESLPPYWIIDGVILNDATVNSRYGAEIHRPTDDSKGRHQAEIIIYSVNETLNHSNVSCAVGSELRMVYILYIIDPGEETIIPGTDSAVHTNGVSIETRESLVNDTSSNGVADRIVKVIAGSVVPIVGIILIGVAVAIVAVCAVRKGWCNIFKIGKYSRKRMDDRVRPDGAPAEEGEDDDKIDDIHRAPTHTSEEQEQLLRHRTFRGAN